MALTIHIGHPDKKLEAEEESWDIDAVAPVHVPPSRYDKIKYGFSSMPGFSESMGNYLERKLPMGRIEWHNDEEGLHVPRWNRPSQEMMDAVIYGTTGSEIDDIAPVDNPALVIQQREKQERLARDHPKVHNTEYANDAAAIVGMLGGALLDPTTAIGPLTGSLKLAGATGAAIGATDMAAYELGETGTVTASGVALGAVIGGVAAVLITKGGRAFADYTASKKASGTPFTERDMADQLRKYDIHGEDPRLLADRLNEALGIKPAPTKTQHTARQKELNKIFKENSEEANYWDWYSRNLDDIRVLDRAAVAGQKMSVEEAAQRTAMQEDLLKKAEVEHMWKAKEAELTKDLDKLDKARTARAMEEAGTQLKLAEIPQSPRVATAMELAFQKAQAQEERTMAVLQRQIARAEAEELELAAARQAQISDVVTDQELQAIHSAPRSPSQQAQGQAARNHPWLTNSEMGGVQFNVLEHMATTTVGAGLGYAWEGEEGAVLGAAIGLGLPWTYRKTYTAIGNAYRNTHEAVVENLAGNWGVGPQSKLNLMGPAGKVGHKMLQEARENIDMAHSQRTFEASKLLDPLPRAEQHAIIAALRNVKELSALTPELKKVAKAMRTMLNATIKDSVDAGVLTAKKAQQLINKANTEGYWPRVFNQAFLTTKAGKDKWVEVFTSQNWSKDSLQDTLTSILGEDAKSVAQFMNLAKRADGSYWLSRPQALRLLEEKGKSTIRNRSNHLEHSRKIHVKDENILDPFLVDNPIAVLTSYFHDAYKRIEMAKMFGAKDQKAMKIAEHIEKDFGTADADYWRSLYFTMVGDSRSKYIAEAINMKEGLKSFYGKINAFETLKLLFAQVINVPQPLINGTLLLSKRTANPFKTFNIAIKGIIRGMGKEGREFAERAGAAAETTIMQTLGEFNEARSILGREATGLFSWFEPINNPTKFLQVTQYVRVETWNRRYAANMGKLYAEDLLRSKAKIEAGLIKGKKADKILAQMEELGLPTNVPHTHVPEEAMLRAGLRFSDEVNFRNSPDKIPLGWNSPHAKIFTKFKSFSFNHGRFVRDNVLIPAATGNPLPLMVYLNLGAPIGMGVDELRRMLRADDRDLTITERYLRGLTSVGGLGILMDTLGSTAYGYAQPIAAVAGPAVSDMSKFLHGLYKSGEQLDYRPARNALIDSLVFPGKSALMEELKEDLKKKKLQRNRGGGRPSRQGRESR